MLGSSGELSLKYNCMAYVVPEPDILYLDDFRNVVNLIMTQVYDHILVSDIGDIHDKLNNTILVLLTL